MRFVHKKLYQCWKQLLNIFVKTLYICFSWFFDDKLKRTNLFEIKQFCNIMTLLSLLIILLHPCWIKLLLSFKKNTKNLTDPKLLNCRFTYTNNFILFYYFTKFFFLLKTQLIITDLSKYNHTLLYTIYHNTNFASQFKNQTILYPF